MSDPNLMWNEPPATLPPPAPDVTQRIAQRVSGTPGYQKIAAPVDQGEKSFGPASFIATPGPVVGAALPVVGPAAAMLAAPAAVAYGIGKLVAPKWTDETVGKIRDFIGRAVQKTAPVGSAYEMGMLESLPGSKFVERKLSQPVQDFISQIKNQHPQAVAVGRTAGTVGQFALPGANIVKGAGLMGTAANAAINAAPYAIGQGLDVGAETGDVGKAIKSGLVSEGLGIAAPTALSWLTKIPAVQRFIIRRQLAGAGMRTSDEVKNLRSYGKSIGLTGGKLDAYVANQAQPLQEKIAGLVDQFGQGRQGKIRMREWNDSGFDAHNSVYEAITGNHVTTDIGNVAGSSDADHVLADPDLRRAVVGRFNPDEVQAAVADMGKKIDGQSWNDARNTILPAYIRAGENYKGNLAADDPRILKAAVADAWRDHIDSIADRSMAWAKEGALGPEAQKAAADVPELHVLKSTYPAIQSIKKAQAREEPFIPTDFAPGSDTFARLATNAALQGGATALGGAVGGPVGAAAAHLAGPILARIVKKGMEKGAGALAGVLKNVGEIPSAALGRAAAQAPSIVESAGGPIAGPSGILLSPRARAARAAAAPPEQIAPVSIPSLEAQPIPNAPLPQPAPIFPVQPSLPAQAPEVPPRAQPFPNVSVPARLAPEVPTLPGPPPGAQPIPLAAPQLSPQEQAQIDFRQAGKPQPFIPTFRESQVRARLDEKYARYVRQYGNYLSRQDYEKAARRATHDFDPMLPNTWKAMFDDSATSDKLYKEFLIMQKIGDIDPDSALHHYTRYVQRVNPRISSEERKQEDQDNAKLVSALTDMTGQPVKAIDERLRQIAFKPTPEERAEALATMMIKEGGIDIPLLEEMGLW